MPLTVVRMPYESSELAKSSENTTEIQVNGQPPVCQKLNTEELIQQLACLLRTGKFTNPRG
jgi:hypothetical protein